MAEEHWRQWVCPFDCLTRFDDSSALETHLMSTHREELDADRAYEVSLRNSHIDDEKAKGKCPLCQHDIKSTHEYTRHVGTHLENLALFALPDTGDSAIDGYSEELTRTEEENQRQNEYLEHHSESSTMSSEKSVDNTGGPSTYVKTHNRVTSSEPGLSIGNALDEELPTGVPTTSSDDYSKWGTKQITRDTKPGVLEIHSENDTKQDVYPKRNEDQEGSVESSNPEVRQRHEHDQGQPSSVDIPIPTSRCGRPRDQYSRVEYQTRRVRVGKSGEWKWRQEKKWFCAWCHFGPLDWTYDTHCVECGSQSKIPGKYGSNLV